MNTLTLKQQEAITAKLGDMYLPRGLGNEETACSIAAINLALSGQLTDDIPQCMSEVVGRWIIWTQDEMPDEMRNSVEWKRLLPLAAGTGRKRERERAAIILSWMWESVLPIVQPVADANGFGKVWKEMLLQRTSEAAAAAADAAAFAAAAAADAAYEATRVATRVAAADAAAFAAAAAAVAAAGSRSYGFATSDEVWSIFNPCGLLEKLIA